MARWWCRDMRGCYTTVTIQAQVKKRWSLVQHGSLEARSELTDLSMHSVASPAVSILRAIQFCGAENVFSMTQCPFDSLR